MFVVNPSTGAVTMDRGDDWTLRVTVKDATGALLDIHADSAKMTVKSSIDDPIANAVIQKTTPVVGGTGIDVVTNGAAGIMDVIGIPADTLNLAGPFVYDAQITHGGKVYTVQPAGLWQVRKNVSTVGVAPGPPIIGQYFPGYLALDGALYKKGADGLYHKYDIVLDPGGSGFYVLDDIGTGGSFPF